MLPGELKPILTALVLPPAAPQLLALLGALLAWRRLRAGIALVLVAVAAGWLLSCSAVAVALAERLLPQVAPISEPDLRSAQAIVVLGGGMLDRAPEYATAQPNASTLRRLRYGARLARQSGKPLAFTGGVGWASAGSSMAPEAQAATEVLADFGVQARWIEGRSRDTRENAAEMHRMLSAAGVRRIALVTEAWHMPRAAREFRQAGFDVLPAPTGFAAGQTNAVLSWIPSADGLTTSRHVVREALARWALSN